MTEKKRFFTPEQPPQDSLFVDQCSDDEVPTALPSIKAEVAAHVPPTPNPIVVDDSDPEDTLRGSHRQSRLHDLIMPAKRAAQEPSQRPSDLPSAGWSRPIGVLSVQAWATRPTTRPLWYKQVLEIKRLTPKKMTFGRTKEKTARAADSAVIRLFSQENGALSREIGRPPADICDMLAPLIDLGIVQCRASVLMDTETRLSLGDSFYIQMEFELNQTAFSDVQLPVSFKRTQQLKPSGASNWNFAQESEEESALRLRQISLVRLFDRLGITPDRTTATDTTAIEVDEQVSMPDATQPIEQLNLDQLKQFYQANQQSELLEGLPETTTPRADNFKMELRAYQKKGLSWMLTREKELDVLNELSRNLDSQSLPTSQIVKLMNEEGMMNPLWKSYTWPGELGLEGDDAHFFANMYSGELALKRPMLKSLVKGGILADEMGLGKTISTLALVCSVPYDTEKAPEKAYASKTTLIVVPMSLLSQWQSEFEKANNNPNHRCVIYYGDQTVKDLRPLLCKHHDTNIPVVVLTTYGTVLNEYSKYGGGTKGAVVQASVGLYLVKFFRIVLDEGHTIRNRSAKTSKAIYELRLTRKWALTGTPVINRLDDLYSIVKFLELEPWCNFLYWKTFVTMPFEQKKIGQTLDVVKSILEPIFLRRTKNMKQKDGQPLVVLPAKEVVFEEIEFSDKERRLYDWFKMRAAKTFKEGLANGELLKKYTQILTHILRLRQVCCHMDLVGAANELALEDEEVAEAGNCDIPHFEDAEDKFSDSEATETIKKLSLTVNFTESECSICTVSPILLNEMVVMPCGHCFCLNCILEHFTYQAKTHKSATCPNCRESILKYKMFRVKQPRQVQRIDQTLWQPSDFLLYLYDPDRSSSKVQALINHLRMLNAQHPGEQVVVFSQFSSYLDIIEKELNTQCSNDLIVYKFDGRLHMNDRKRVLDDFALDKKTASTKTTVLLLSLKAGGVGLNLTSASRAFMMDPWWSPSVEDQAIDRIHRIGQVENVKVVRFIMKDSIEQKMLKIQERKKQIGEAVAAEEEERAKRRIEEIQMLFEE